MKKPALTLIAAIASLLAACRPVSYRVEDGGVVVRLRPRGGEAPFTLRLQVIADDIIRVTATPGAAIVDGRSLAVIAGPAAAGRWSVREGADGLELATPSLRALVATGTGGVSFLDARGRVLLAEAPNGRTFAAITVDGTPGYTVRQVFDPPGNEALYGLGQHQSEEIDYKGKNEELFQYNTKVSVPFIVSTGNYGLLWDNTSLTRFGDPANSSPSPSSGSSTPTAGRAGSRRPISRTPIRRRSSPGAVSRRSITRTRDGQGLPGRLPLLRLVGQLGRRDRGSGERHLSFRPLLRRIHEALDRRAAPGGQVADGLEPQPGQIRPRPEKESGIPCVLNGGPTGASPTSGCASTRPSGRGTEQDLVLVGDGRPDRLLLRPGRRHGRRHPRLPPAHGQGQVIPRWAMGFWQSRSATRPRKSCWRPWPSSAAAHPHRQHRSRLVLLARGRMGQP